MQDQYTARPKFCGFKLIINLLAQGDKWSLLLTPTPTPGRTQTKYYAFKPDLVRIRNIRPVRTRPLGNMKIDVSQVRKRSLAYLEYAEKSRVWFWLNYKTLKTLTQPIHELARLDPGCTAPTSSFSSNPISWRSLMLEHQGGKAIALSPPPSDLPVQRYNIFYNAFHNLHN